MTAPAFRKLTEDEYLRLLEESDVRYEYVDGFVYAQAGAASAHNQIGMNLAVLLSPAARKAGCLAYQSDMRLQLINAARTYYFPDFLVTCEPATPKTMFVTQPCLVVEILSPSTARIDRHQKWMDYQQLASLQTYLMIDGQARAVSVYQRTEQGWEYRELGEDDSLTLDCPPVTLTLADIYDGTSL